MRLWNSSLSWRANGLKPEHLTASRILFGSGHTIQIAFRVGRILDNRTLAAGLAWTWYLLSQHPAVEGKLARELKHTLGGRIPRFDDLVSLPYIRRLFEEALRLYPPTWILARSPLSDDAIGGYRIHRKSVLLISPYLMHRHPQFWVAQKHSIPSGLGPRDRKAGRATPT